MAVRSLAQSSIRQSPQINSMLAGYSGNQFHHLETIRLSASATSVELTNLARYSDYQHLQLRVVAKNAATVGYNMLEMVMRINTSNSGYRSHSLTGSGSSVSSGDVSLSSQMLVGYTVSSDSGVGPTFASSIIDILDPFETKNKTVRSFSGGGDSRSTLGPLSSVGLWSGAWFNTTPVNSLTLYGAYGSGGTLASFAAGSRFSLYGLKARA